MDFLEKIATTRGLERPEILGKKRTNRSVQGLEVYMAKGSWKKIWITMRKYKD